MKKVMSKKRKRRIVLFEALNTMQKANLLFQLPNLHGDFDRFGSGTHRLILTVIDFDRIRGVRHELKAT